MGRFSKILLLGVVFALAFVVAQPATAQISTGSISGTVVDQTGGSVPGATVTLTNRGTGAQSSLTTPENGSFRFGLLPVGIYDLEIKKQGFKKLKLTSVAVNANVEHGVSNVVLELGAATATVEVSAAPPIIETAQAQITTSVSGAQMQSFPGVAENEGLDFLALQVPGVVNTRDNSFSNTNGVGFSVNGIRGRGNDQQIDGQNNNDNSVAGPGLFLSNVDFVNEYQITTNNFGPEYGRNSGSVVNIVTKSGTNNWHGTVSGTESNSTLSARTNAQIFFEGLKKVPRFNDEFTGATIGGPIWKDKVFMFGGFDDEILSSTFNFASGLSTPTPLGIAQLSACYPGSTSVAALQAFGPYGVGGGNPKPLGTPGPQSASFGKTTCSVEMAGVQRLLGDSFHEYDWVYRIDVHVSNADSFFGRYIYNKQVSLNSDAFATAAAGYPANVPSLSQAFLGDWTHTFSSRVLNEVRVSFSRLNVEFGGNSIGNTIPLQGSIGNALARVSFSDPTLLGFGPATNAPQGRIVNTYQAQDNFNYSMGRHQLKAGVNFTYQRSPNIFLPNLNGAFRFANWGAFGANAPNRIQIANGDPNLDFREYDTFLYVGDDWKVKDNLTLNLGLTWSYYGQPANLFHNITTKRESNPATAFWLTSLPLADRTFPNIPAPKTSFGPSAGFAYSPHWGGFLTGNGKTVIRGGYRLTYDPPFYNIYVNISSSAPEVFLQTLGDVAGLPADPVGPNVRALLASSLKKGTLDPRNFARTSITPNFGPDRVHSWTFGIQREITKKAVFEARYAGNKGENLFQSINGNPFIAGTAAVFPNFLPSGVTPCATPVAGVPSAAGRVHCDSGPIRIRTNTGYSDYHAIQTEFRSTNLFNQLTLRTGYTFSKTTDNVSEIFSTFGGATSNAFSQNPLDFTKGEHGLSGLDFPNNWTASFVEDIPFKRSEHGVLGHVLGGWAFSGTYILASGQPYSPIQSAMNFFTGGVANDEPFDATFIGTFETSRAFVGSPSAPVSQVGIFAGDACSFYAFTGSEPVCGLPPDTLISLNGLNPNTFTKAALLAYVPAAVSKQSVRFIANGGEADAVFGTPFGNAARNSVRDYHTDVGNFTLFKNIKFGERATLQWHMTMLNVFNHPNFYSIDPFIEDAGLALLGEGVGFGIPSQYNGGLFNGSGPGREIRFGLKVVF